MQVSRLVVGFVPLLLVAVCAAAAPGEENPAAAAAPLKVEASSLTEVTATVEAINSATRSVTLKGVKGEVVTFTADERINLQNAVDG